MKRLLSILTIVLMLASLSSIALAFEPTTDQTHIRTTLLSQIPDPARPGQYAEIRVGIESLGERTPTNFEIEIVDSFPFSIDNEADRKKFYGKIPGGFNNELSVIAKWDVRVADNAVEGENDLTVRYKFDQAKNWVYQDLEVDVRTSDTILNIPQITTHPKNIAPGDAFNLTITLDNNADSPAQNVVVDLTLADPFVSLGSTNEQYVTLLEGKEQRDVTFTLITDGDADQTIYRIPIDISWEDSEGTTREKSMSFGVIVSDTPKIIENLEQTDIFTKGDKGTFTVSLSNLGVEEIKFVNLKLNPSDNYDIISTNQIYVGNIDSDDFENSDFTIFVKEGDESIPLLLDLSYTDQLNREYNEELSVNLPLYSTSEAKRFGLVPQGNIVGSYISFTLAIFVLLFWVSMFVDLLARKMKRYQKWTWVGIFILTTVFGALLYYFMIKRRKA